MSNKEMIQGGMCETENLNYKMPIYLQLREIIRSRIEDGEYLPGTSIPSENKLADTYGINRLTVRNALNALVNEGVLKRVQGKGVFVVGEKHETKLDFCTGFENSVSVEQKGVTVKESAKLFRAAGNKYANYFNIEENDLIFYIRHNISLNNEPLAIEEIYIPRDVLPELESVDSSVFTIRDIFSFYDISIKSVQQTLEIVNGMQKIRKMLSIPENIAIMMLSCDYKDEKGRAVAFTRSYIRSDKSYFSIRMH